MYLKALFGAGLLAAALAPVSASALVIGGYDLDNAQFGNTLIESDGGEQSSGRWLNLVNADPGNPAYLTGANLNTGIANIGLYGDISYTIGYNTPISNGLGYDFAVITTRFSADAFYLAVSEDASTFTYKMRYGAELAINTGLTETFWYGGGGPYEAGVFITLIDLSDFGIADGASVSAITINSKDELDLLRIAGLKRGTTTNPPSDVPEPATLALFGAGLGALGLRRRRKA